MGIMSSGNSAVDAMGEIPFTGNITPPIWYKRILLDTGKPDFVAVTLLSDIVYWYRPMEVRDEATGFVSRLQKRFKGDLLQRSYRQYENQYGIKKRIVKEAMDRLEKQGLIRREFRDITLENKTKLMNVMYIDIFPEKIAEISRDEITQETSGPTVQRSEIENEEVKIKPVEITVKSSNNEDSNKGGTKYRTTSPEKSYDPIRNNVSPHTENGGEVIRKNEGGITEKRGTNTENTTEITNGDYSVTSSLEIEEPLKVLIYSAMKSKFPKQAIVKCVTMGPDGQINYKESYINLIRLKVRYEGMIRDELFMNRKGMIDGIINIIADMAITTPPDGVEWINGRAYPYEVVRNRLLEINFDVLSHVLAKLKETKTQIKSLRRYILTTIYNAFDEMDISLQAEVNYDMFGGGWIEKGII
jgi:hypothetical protein